MNGQMFQIASIVATSKKALQLSEPIRFSQLEYENKIEFVFLPQKKFLRTEKYTASNVSLWFANKTRLKLFNAALTAATWTKISVQ